MPFCLDTEHCGAIVTLKGMCEHLPRSLKYPTTCADERAPPSQVTLSAQTASPIVGCLSEMSRH